MTDVPYGNYTISSYSWDTDDNTYIIGTVFVTIIGDVNGDGTVDAYDLFELSKNYGKTI